MLLFHYSMICVNGIQCDKIGRFLKVLVDKILHKKLKYLVTFWANYKNITL